jgi:hypothetical protein
MDIGKDSCCRHAHDGGESKSRSGLPRSGQRLPSKERSDDEQPCSPSFGLYRNDELYENEVAPSEDEDEVAQSECSCSLKP